MRPFPIDGKTSPPSWLVAPDPDLPEAEQYISALHGGVNAVCTWQTFMDAKGGPADLRETMKAALRRKTFRQVEEHLRLRNSAWAGVYVVVNTVAAVEGGGRGLRDVVAPTALWMEDDCGNTLPAYKLTPSMVVMSKSGPHSYWLLRPGESLDEQRGALQALAFHYRMDPAVAELGRVLRVPGFRHLKDPAHPFLVRLIHVEPERLYSIAEVLAAHGLKPPSDKTWKAYLLWNRVRSGISKFGGPPIPDFGTDEWAAVRDNAIAWLKVAHAAGKEATP